MNNALDSTSVKIADKECTAQQLQKWLNTGIVIGPFDEKQAKKNNASLHMLFGIPKPDRSTRPIMNFSDEKHM